MGGHEMAARAAFRLIDAVGVWRRVLNFAQMFVNRDQKGAVDCTEPIESDRSPTSSRNRLIMKKTIAAVVVAAFSFGAYAQAPAAAPATPATPATPAVTAATPAKPAVPASAVKHKHKHEHKHEAVKAPAAAKPASS